VATRIVSAYLHFVHSGTGGAAIAILSVAVCAALVVWVRRQGRPERGWIFGVACVMAALGAGIYWSAVASGWWSGAYFQTPPLIQALILLPVSLTWWVVWLLGYGWLAARNRHALLIYPMLMALFIVVMDVVDRANASRGLFIVSEDGTVWIYALVGAVISLAPLLLYEWARNRLAREFLP
jgi:hypothetical protein